jgi:hypothetical protein
MKPGGLSSQVFSNLSRCLVLLVTFMQLRMPVLGSDVRTMASSTDSHQVAVQKYQTIGGIDPLTMDNFISSQIFVANTACVFPTLPLLRLTPSLTFDKLDVFQKSDIGNHMYYGAHITIRPQRIPDPFAIAERVIASYCQDCRRRHVSK